MVRKASRKEVPEVQVPRRKATDFEIASNSLLVELDKRKVQHEQKWGVERLITLVDSEFRVKFWGQMGRVWDALDFQDIDKLGRAVNGMVKGYDALEKWAEDNEVDPNPAIRFVEWLSQKGQRMAVCQTLNDAINLQVKRKDLTIWSLEEMEVILNDELVQEVIKVKAFDPTAKVISFKAGEGFGKGSGFEDMENDLHAFEGSDEYVPKYKKIGED
jgi:hypothetical protein